LISRDAYIRAGGMCPRSKLKYFEDYDFWLRMDAFGYHGKLVREPLFWYRRHEFGNSNKLLKKAKSRNESWMTELKEFNPVTFGDVTLSEARRILKEQELNTGRSRKFMPCFRNITARRWTRLGKGLKTFWGLRGYTIIPKIPLQEHGRNRLVSSSIFPYAKAYFERRPDHHQVAYAIPWMVMGGADLYDIGVLSSMQEPSFIESRVTYTALLIVARHIPYHEWYHKFEPLVSEIFYLQQYTNDTKVADWIMDYLVQSRGSSLFINSRTIPGYDAIARWGTKSAELNNGIVPRNLVAKYLKRRVVVTEHLRQHLINDLGYGDHQLGVLSPQSRGQLSPTDSNKVKVIPPPLDLSYWSSHHPRDREWLDNNTSEPPADVRHVPTLFFIGRFDHQKDPNLWLDKRPTGVPLRLVMIGSGPLLPKIRSYVRTNSLLSNAISFVETAKTDHVNVLRELSRALVAVTLISSSVEGLPIVALESAGLGAVVSTDCGGISEAFSEKYNRAEETAVSGSLKTQPEIAVKRTSLSAIIDVKCEDIGKNCEVLRIIGTEALSREASVMKRRQLWKAADKLRDFYNDKAFRSRWRTLLDGLAD
ncbi:hypothetical protein BC829DRAFT_379057, partial [Chytridium lagenaria]